MEHPEKEEWARQEAEEVGVHHERVVVVGPDRVHGENRLARPVVGLYS